MIVRCRTQLVPGICLILSTLSGCSDQLLSGPIQYVESASLTKDAGKSNLAGKPKLQQKVRDGLANLFGPNPREMRVPDGMGVLLRSGGARLGNYLREGDRKLRIKDPNGTLIAGGYGLYRRHCLHCHGVSGAGDGPTAAFLYPIPRDYRKGLFKFTSTPNGARPHREDLVRTVRNGLHGTSMPAFEALMSDEEINQAVDYVIFLSVRGETELSLIDEASIADESDINALSPDDVKASADGVINKWKVALGQIVNPAIPRTPSTRDSIERGRQLFLGKTKEKLECAGCHGSLARGDGPSFVSQDVFNHVVFGGDPSTRAERIAGLDAKTKELWGQKLDEWGNPLRPANLNRGIYKGGRRPIDIYWRIAKGITGAQMPAHYPTIDHKQIWDLVNFVLALPYEPDLLREHAGETHAVANR